MLFEFDEHFVSHRIANSVKPVLSDRWKIDNTKILMADGSLLKVKSIAECSKGEHSAMLLTCIKR